jgi:hypothetical protein
MNGCTAGVPEPAWRSAPRLLVTVGILPKEKCLCRKIQNIA